METPAGSPMTAFKSPSTFIRDKPANEAAGAAHWRQHAAREAPTGVKQETADGRANPLTWLHITLQTEGSRFFFINTETDGRKTSCGPTESTWPARLNIDLLIGLCQRNSQRMLREADGLTVAAHVGVAADGVPHFGKGQVGHGDGAAAQHLEAWLAVEGDEKILTHQYGAAHVGKAAEVLQVAPHQDGAFALLSEGAVHGEDVDVDGGAAGLMKGQRFLVSENTV